MKTGPNSFPALSCVILAGVAVFLQPVATGDEKREEKREYEKAAAKQAEVARQNLPRTIEEARGRARWIHELMHGSLQVVHRDFFGDGDDESLALPSQSLDDVFAEMARSWNVEIRWLGVNATKGSDHEPQDRFEEAAADALLEGALEHEKVERGNYRFVGVVHIKNECLKCHDRNRTSVEEKLAGLAISIPLRESEELRAAVGD